MIIDDLTYQQFFVEVSNGNQCAIHNMYKNDTGIPVVMIHGAVESGNIFFSNSGKGFGPFLARNGFNVFIIDLPGKGSSIPKVKKGFKSGMLDFINIDLNRIYEFIAEKNTSNKDWIGVAHSWGGVLLLSNYAKFNTSSKISKHILFGVKKNVKMNSFGKIARIKIGLSAFGKMKTKIEGFFNAVKYNMGSDNEPSKFFYEMEKWVSTKKWEDKDGFNFSEGIKNKPIPKVLNIIAKNDKFYGEKGDSDFFMTQCFGKNHSNITQLFLSKKNGFLKDYEHNNMLSYKKATEDHFLRILEWIKDN